MIYFSLKRTFAKYKIRKRPIMQKTLVIGSGGQIGVEIVRALAAKQGKENVFASDLHEVCPAALSEFNYLTLNALDKTRLEQIIDENQITDVYLLAALLSATAEKNIAFAWELNMDGLFHVLNLAKEGKIKKVFWPSSIAVFGPTTPRINTPQETVMEPTTVYGISKLAGELWCSYYHRVFGVDVRSIRYPGLISYQSLPGGGTTDYAVDIFYHALKNGTYTSFLSENTALPMMFMEDAIRATLELMDAPVEKVKVRTAYNLGGISFTPAELAASIQKFMPEFTINYAPDFRQKIADSWPDSIDDTVAQQDWGWKPKYDLELMTKTMLDNVDAGKLV
jgi:nucleoside-diphosphate-sugar epimerase